VERQLVAARSAALKTDGSMPATSPTPPRPASCRTAGCIYGTCISQAAEAVSRPAWQSRATVSAQASLWSRYTAPSRPAATRAPCIFEHCCAWGSRYPAGL